jgi:hypothetical protein
LTGVVRSAKLRAVASKSDLMDWVLRALRELGGSAGVVDVSKRVWSTHASDLAASGDLFFTWQYDLRWAAQKLRYAGTLKPVQRSNRNAKWELA